MAQTEAHLPATSRRVAARRALLNPANLIPFPVLGAARARAPLPLHRRQAAVADPRRDGPHADRARRRSPSRSRPARANARPRLLLTAQIVLTGLCVYIERLGRAARGRLRVRRRDRHPLRRLALRVVGDGLHRAHGRRRRARDRARLGEDDGARARGPRARAARGRRHVRGDLDPRLQPAGEGARRGLAAPERAPVPRAGAARLRHHPRGRVRRDRELREPGVRDDPRLLSRASRSAC